jgi:hypothetical protein
MVFIILGPALNAAHPVDIKRKQLRTIAEMVFIVTTSPVFFGKNASCSSIIIHEKKPPAQRRKGTE